LPIDALFPVHVHSTVHARQVGTSGAVETHHLHARWQKARALAKLRDVQVSAVGWDAEGAGDDTTGCGRCVATQPLRIPRGYG